MIQRVFIPGVFPTMNSFEHATRWSYRRSKDNWMRIMVFYIKQANLKPMGRIRITYQWREKDRRRDPDNFSGMGKKFANDSLVHAGIIADDGWDQIVGWSESWIVDERNPGVELILEEIP